MQIEGPVQVARRSDMDMNGHINNVTYLGWALETVPADVYLNYSLLEVCRLPAQNLIFLRIAPPPCGYCQAPPDDQCEYLRLS